MAPDYERGVFELVRAPLDPLALEQRVAHPSCGQKLASSGYWF